MRAVYSVYNSWYHKHRMERNDTRCAAKEEYGIRPSFLTVEGSYMDTLVFIFLVESIRRCIENR